MDLLDPHPELNVPPTVSYLNSNTFLGASMIPKEINAASPKPDLADVLSPFILEILDLPDDKAKDVSIGDGTTALFLPTLSTTVGLSSGLLLSPNKIVEISTDEPCSIGARRKPPKRQNCDRRQNVAKRKKGQHQTEEQAARRNKQNRLRMSQPRTTEP
uniref:Uncharacterized protein n=1 Tax=Glossina pallidipes TaxID=7398 RepID=A0A1A9Z1Y8_GLOPL